MAAEQVDVVVRGKDEASKTLRDVSDSLRDLGKRGGEAGSIFDEAAGRWRDASGDFVSAADSAASGVDSAAKEMTKSLGKVEAAAGGGGEGGGGLSFALKGVGAAAAAGAAAATVAIGTIVAGLMDISGKANIASTALQGLGGVDMEGLLQDAALLEGRYGVDAQEAINATKALMTEFGLTSDEATSMLIAGFDAGMNTSGDFLDSIGEYANQFSGAGATAAEFFSVLQTGQANGVLGTDKIADAFKEFGVRMLDGSGTTSGALETLLGGFTDNSAEIEKTEAKVTSLQAKLAKLKGAKTQDPAAIAAVSQELQRQQADLTGLNRTQGQFNAGFAEFAGGGAELMRQISTGEMSVANAMPLIQQALANISDPMQQAQLGVALFGTQWEDLGAKAILGTDMAAMGMSEINAAADAGRARFDSLGEIGPRMWADFTTALLPVNDALLVFASEMLPILQENLGPVKDFIVDAATGFINFASGLASGATEGGVLASAIAGWQPTFDALKEWVGGIADWFTTKLWPALSDAGSGFSTMLQPHIEWMADFVTNTLMPALADFGKFLGDNLPGLINTLAPIITGVLNVALSALELALKAIWTVWETYVKPVLVAGLDTINKWTGGWDNLARGATVLKQSLSDVGKMLKGIIDGALKMPEWMIKGFEALGVVTVTGGEPAAGGAAGGSFASGTTFAPGGVSLVGERGPELVNLPRGSGVVPAARTKAMLAGGSASMAPVFNISIGSVDSEDRARQIAAEMSAQVQRDFSRAIDKFIQSEGVA